MDFYAKDFPHFRFRFGTHQIREFHCTSLIFFLLATIDLKSVKWSISLIKSYLSITNKGPIFETRVFDINICGGLRWID
jgi:hypothetical protein